MERNVYVSCIMSAKNIMSILRYERIMVGKYVQRDIKNVGMLISSTIGYINGKYKANKKRNI